MSLLWNRFTYFLSPQFDVYRELSNVVRDTVADIGFGTGFGTHLLSLKAKEVYAYEIDEEAIQFAQEVFPFRQLHFGYGDIQKGIAGQTFDFVLMVDVLEHLRHERDALEHAKDMLKKGGTLIISTPNRLSRYRKSANHVREYAPKELEGILKRVFVSVQLKNYRMEPLASQYENPLLAFCRNEAVTQYVKEKANG